VRSIARGIGKGIATLKRSAVHVPCNSGGTSREGSWEEVSAHIQKQERSRFYRFSTEVRHQNNEPLGHIAAHPRLVHVSQGTYKDVRKPAETEATPSQPRAFVAKYGRRAFRSHLNLSLANRLRSEQRNIRGELEGGGVRTVCILHKTRGHALVFAAAGVEAHYLVMSRSFARLVAVLYALHNAARRSEKKNSNGI
jgi:hypothetical protein